MKQFMSIFIVLLTFLSLSLCAKDFSLDLIDSELDNINKLFTESFKTTSSVAEEITQPLDQINHSRYASNQLLQHQQQIQPQNQQKNHYTLLDDNQYKSFLVNQRLNGASNNFHSAGAFPQPQAQQHAQSRFTYSPQPMTHFRKVSQTPSNQPHNYYQPQTNMASTRAPTSLNRMTSASNNAFRSQGNVQSSYSNPNQSSYSNINHGVKAESKFITPKISNNISSLKGNNFSRNINSKEVKATPVTNNSSNPGHKQQNFYNQAKQFSFKTKNLLTTNSNKAFLGYEVPEPKEVKYKTISSNKISHIKSEKEISQKEKNKKQVTSFNSNQNEDDLILLNANNKYKYISPKIRGGEMKKKIKEISKEYNNSTITNHTYSIDNLEKKVKFEKNLNKTNDQLTVNINTSFKFSKSNFLKIPQSLLKRLIKQTTEKLKKELNEEFNKKINKSYSEGKSQQQLLDTNSLKAIKSELTEFSKKLLISKK